MILGRAHFQWVGRVRRNKKYFVFGPMDLTAGILAGLGPCSVVDFKSGYGAVVNKWLMILFIHW